MGGIRVPRLFWSLKTKIDFSFRLLMNGLYRFSRKITSQLQNWAILTYLHGKNKNTYICLIWEHQNVSNTSRHQEIAMLLLNLPCYSHFSYLENFERSFWKIIIFAVVMLFFWRSDIVKIVGIILCKFVSNIVKLKT